MATNIASSTKATRGFSLAACLLLLLFTLAGPAFCLPPLQMNTSLRATTKELMADRVQRARDVLANMPADMGQLPGVLPQMTAKASATKLQFETGSAEFKKYSNEYDLHYSSNKRLNLKLTTSLKATSAVWQIAVFPYDHKSADWKNPAGLVATGNMVAPTPGESTTFSINFDFCVLTTHLKANTDGPKTIKTGVGGNKLGGLTRPPMGTVDHNNPTPLALQPPQENYPFSAPNLSSGWVSYTAALPAGRTYLPAKMDYYLRAVLLDAAGNIVGTPSAPVIIHYGPDDVADQQQYIDIGKGIVNAVLPSAEIIKYKPLQFEKTDAMYHVVVTKNPFAGVPFIDNKPYQVGAKMDLTPKTKDKSWWDKFTGAIGDFIDFVANAVNWVSNAYASIKEFAVGSICGILGDWARGPLMLMLDSALASIGVPPSLPNFDELTGMGKDYLTSMVAEQTGLPADQIKDVVNKVAEKAKSEANGGTNPVNWFRPDPDYQYQPGMVMIKVTNNNKVRSDKINLSLDNLSSNGGKPYNGASAPIPALNPGESITVPIMLYESLPKDYYIVTSDPKSYNTLNDWEKSFYAPKIKISVAATYRYDPNDKTAPVYKMNSTKGVAEVNINPHLAYGF